MQVADSPSQRHQGLSNQGTGDYRRDEKGTPYDQAENPHLVNSLPSPGGSCPSVPKEPAGPIASPLLHPDHLVVRKDTADQPDGFLPGEQTGSSFETPPSNVKLQWWLSNLASSENFEDQAVPEVVDGMNRPTLKRLRSSSPSGLLESRDRSGSSASTGTNHSVYNDVGYPRMLESKGGYMRGSKLGMAKEDREFCEKLLTASQPITSDPLFSDDLFDKFRSNLRGRSEARLCSDLHTRLVPSVENLDICGREEFAGLSEGHNDLWTLSIPFCGPRPQPDHTYGFKCCNFTEQQLRKLMTESKEKSYYKARDNLYFPFLTAEVKCDKAGLEIAERQNVHSMTVQIRGIVDLYRQINRPQDLHRRVLGFSISHDATTVRIHAYYPEIDGEKTTYWREHLRTSVLDDDHGKDRWTSYQFTLNVCQMFALPLLERLKHVIDKLPDPFPQSLVEPFDNVSIDDSQDDLSIATSQTKNLKKPRGGQSRIADLQNANQILKRKLDKQQREAKERETLLSEQQQRSSQQQLEQLQKTLEQQQRSSQQQLEQQQRSSQQQLEQLQKTLEQQQRSSQQQLEQQQRSSQQQLERLQKTLEQQQRSSQQQLEQLQKTLEQLQKTLEQQQRSSQQQQLDNSRGGHSSK